ncbi:hypothetical protein DFQ30_008369 [Apophysomyces sp. BC1015]|nr:hypothetical protein DFQ30_008369 [Apophysomyces sp. BC1015]
MKIRSALFWACGLSYLCLTAKANGFSHPKFKQIRNRQHNTGQYLVEFKSDAAVDSNSFIRDIESEVPGIELTLRRSFSHELFNGVSFEVDGLQETNQHQLLEAIVAKDDVLHVYPNTKAAHPSASLLNINNDVDKETVKTLLPHSMTQVDRVHKELKLTGKDMLVCILDSGIDYDHPALGGGFGPGHRVSVGSDTADGKPTPMDSCQIGTNGASGHGTHVAGISAGKGASKSFIGVAPEANIGFWKVFQCDTGVADDDDIMDGLLQAYDNKCDVINLSLGGENEAWSETGQAVLVEKLNEKGLPVVVSASNEGSFGAFTVASPATAKSTMSVASIDNNYYLARLFEARIGSLTGKIMGSYVYQVEPSAFDLIPHGEVVMGSIGIQNACNNQKVNPEVSEKIAILVPDESCTELQQVQNVAEAGAIGVVFVAGTEAVDAVGVQVSSIPVVTINVPAFKEIAKELKKKTSVFLHFSRAGFAQELSTGGYVSEFSSVGPNNDLDLHPTIAGPGGEIFSTLPRYIGSWGSMSGTSMAAPYLTGAVALFVQAWKNKGQKVTPQFIFEQFQNYAVQINAGPLHKDIVDNPIRQGAGMLQLYDAIQQTVHISPSQISFNDTASVQQYKTHVLTITNSGSEQASYHVQNKIATGIIPYKLSGQSLTVVSPKNYFKKSSADVTFTPSEVTIAPGHSKKVTVKVTIPSDKVNSTEHAVYGGYVHFEAQQEKHKDITVPYFGMWGKQHDLPVIDMKKTSITDRDGSKAYFSEDTYYITVKDRSTAATISVRLLMPSALVMWELYDEQMNAIATIDSRTYVDSSQFDGTTVDMSFRGIYMAESGGKMKTQVAKKGNYRIVVSALKMFGDPDKENDWDTWTSGPVVIQ